MNAQEKALAILRETLEQAAKVSKEWRHRVLSRGLQSAVHVLEKGE